MKIYKFYLDIQFTNDTFLPEIKASMFRGLFGNVFKDSVCIIHGEKCEDCILKSQCSYFNVFETEITEHQLSYLQKVLKTPHPYVINSHTVNKTNYQKDEIATLEVIIFENYIKLLPFFVHTFIKMGEKGLGVRRNKFKLINVNSLQNNYTAELIYNINTKKLKTDVLPFDINHNLKIPATLKLNFVTPVRLQTQGIITNNPKKVTNEVLTDIFLRRYDIINHLFSKNEPLNFTQFQNTILIQQNNLIFKDYKRYSNRQKTKMDFGGFVGLMNIEVQDEQMLKIIETCQHINIGKNTSFGLGKFEINYELHNNIRYSKEQSSEES